MLGKLTWDAIPLDQPIPLIAGAGAFAIVALVVIYVLVMGWGPIYGASGSPASITSISASCTCSSPR